MKNPHKFTIRDILAVPFHIVGYFIVRLGIAVGGEWTAWTIIDLFRDTPSKSHGSIMEYD